MRAAPEAGSQAKWKVVGDKALSAWQMDLAQEAFEKAGDLPALLLLFTSLSDRAGMERLAKLALSRGQNNIAFASFLQLGDTAACIDLLSKTGRLPEAALFARSYAPQQAAPVVKAWKAELVAAGRQKVADTIADPEEDGSLFPELSPSQHTSEGSGVMVERPDEEEVDQPPATAAAEEAQTKAVAVVEEVRETIKDKFVEPVEGLVEKVKDLSVGNGDGSGELSLPLSVTSDRRSGSGESWAKG